ncbi:MAG: peptidyl-prolyl cis-trans isomerase [Planctomycetes bacterium]|nr:peptidyl-prolyl cis-trans isomerase [Planctomycetota bacterium]
MIKLFLILSLTGGSSEEILCRINDEVITRTDIILEMNKNEVPLSDKGINRYLKNKVKEKVLLIEAKRLSLEVTKEEIDREIQRVQKKFDNEEAFNNYLKFRKVTLHEFILERKLQLLLDKVMVHKYWSWLFDPTGAVFNEFVTPSEIKKYYDDHINEFNTPATVSVLYITLRYTNEQEKIEKQRLARSLLRKIENHTDFWLLTTLYSDLKVNVITKEEILKVKVDKMEKSSKFFDSRIMDEIFKINRGNVTGVLDDGLNLYIVLVYDKIESRSMTFEQAQPFIKDRIESEKRMKNERKLIQELLKTVQVSPSGIITDD